MTNFDREEFETAAKERAPREDRRNLQMIQHAGVSAANMTGDPDWDRCLSYWQDAVDKNTQQRTAFLADLMNPLLVNADEIAKRRIAILRLTERIEVLSYVIAMPNQLKKLGDIAAEKLKVLTEIEESQAA